MAILFVENMCHILVIKLSSTCLNTANINKLQCQDNKCILLMKKTAEPTFTLKRLGYFGDWKVGGGGGGA